MSAAPGIEALRSAFGERLLTGEAVRAQHSGGEAYRGKQLPAAVIFAETTAQVADILRCCHAHRMPVVPFGAGTSVEGQLDAVPGSLAIDLSRMDKILSVAPDDLDCRVEAGVTREALNTHLRDTGLMFPVDPGANATLGGMASTRASGTNAVRYGTMRELVLGLTVVTPQGEIVTTGSKARKASTGYDLTELYIGAEGTLGIITEVQLRLFGRPESVIGAVAQFGALGDAVAAATQALQYGLPVARIELLDAFQMRASIAYAKLSGLAEAPTLFLEFHGSEAGAAEVAQSMQAIAQSFGGSFHWARGEQERAVLWRARHDALWAARAMGTNRAVFVTDACVPISRLAECILESQAEATETGLCCPIVGHVGDGNFHMLIVHDPADPAERATAERLSASIAARAIRLGGACSGEHGIGVHKLDFMERQHGVAALGIMRAIKDALDPRGIMNPGKLVPPAPAAWSLAASSGAS